MPLNGLKEEDKEPIIELFVKVSARLRPTPPSPRRSPGRGGRRPWALLSRSAPARRPALGPRGSAAPAPPGHCLRPPAPSSRRGPSREPGWDRDPRKTALLDGGGTASRRAGLGGRRTVVPRAGGTSCPPPAGCPGSRQPVGPVHGCVLSPPPPRHRPDARPHLTPPQPSALPSSPPAREAKPRARRELMS